MRLIPVMRCARIDMQRYSKRDGRHRRIFHNVTNDRYGLFDFIIRHFEDQFIVHLQQHARGKIFAPPAHLPCGSWRGG